MSKETLELADRIEITPAYTTEEMRTRLPVRQCDHPPGSGRHDVRVILVHEQHREKIVAALRAAAVARPEITVNGFRRCPANGEDCLCDDEEARGCYDISGSLEYPVRTAIDEILAEQAAKLDALLGATLDRIEVIEGPRCNRYNRAFNIYGHPYWQGCMLSGLGFFGGLA